MFMDLSPTIDNSSTVVVIAVPHMFGFDPFHRMRFQQRVVMCEQTTGPPTYDRHGNVILGYNRYHVFVRNDSLKHNIH